MSKRLPWYKRDVDAWRSGTRGMSIELRGFYGECIDAMWDLGGPIPIEPENLAVMLSCNPRTIRKLLPQLIALGKLKLTADGYINERMAAEIEAANSSPIRREFEPNSRRGRAEFPANSPPIPAELSANVPKNPMISTRVLENEEEESEGRIRQTARANPPDRLKQSFNGQTSNMLGDIGGWMGTNAEDPQARKWLESMLDANGQQATVQSYQMLITAQTEGQLIASPLRYWSKTASTLKAKQPQPGKKTLADVFAQIKSAEEAPA